MTDIPIGATTIYSAHGVSPQIRAQASERQLRVFDATCPLVTKVHLEVARLSKKDIECILIGHRGHPEVEGTMGQYDNEKAGIYLIESLDDVGQLTLKNKERCAYVTQTTLSVDDTTAIVSALAKRFPSIQGPRKDDICYATQNRQDAVKSLAQQVDVMIVVGSPTSSNSNRLCELAIRLGVPAYLVDRPNQLQQAWIDGVQRIGVTAGASAPESLVQQMILRLEQWGATMSLEQPGKEETIVFALPKVLRKAVTKD